MSASYHLVNTDVVNIQCLDILQQSVVFDLCDLAEGMSYHLSVVIYKNGFVVIFEEFFQFLLVVFGRIGFI